MEGTIKSKVRKGFTLARWGVDCCYGALFITIALIVSALMNASFRLLNALVVPVGMCILGLVLFLVGRTIVGLQSRKLNLHTDRPLAEEEIWFVSSMLEIEEKGAGAHFYNSAARMTGGALDDLAAGAVGAKLAGSFFKVGKRFMGKNIIINRFPAIISFVIAIIIIAIFNI